MKYYQNNRVYNFTTNIIKSTPYGKEYHVILEETYFYPEGGGQPGDLGYINSTSVINTIKSGSDIIHICSDYPGDGLAECRLDREHRDHYMLQHTAQHLMSAVLKHELDINTLSVHLGEPDFTIEIDREKITDSEISQLESKALELISEGISVQYHETDDEGLKEFKIRRESKYSGYIRVVEIEDYDAVPCGGVHLSKLSKIGLIKITGTEKIRGNIRLNLLAGNNALTDYQYKSTVTQSLNRELSSQDSTLLESFHNLQSVIGSLKLEKKLLIDNLLRETLKSYNTDTPDTLSFENYPMKLYKKISTKLSESSTKPLLLLNRTERLMWVLINPSENPVDLNEFRNNLLPLIDGKGGGKPQFLQGSGNLQGEVAFIEEFKKLLVPSV